MKKQGLVRFVKDKFGSVLMKALPVIYLVLVYCNPVFAVSKIPGGEGTVKLVGDVTTALQVIAIPVAALYFAWRSGQLGLTDDQGDESRYKKLRNKVIWTVIFIELAPFIINWFTGYYKMGK